MINGLETSSPMVVGDTEFNLTDERHNRAALAKLLKDARTKRVGKIKSGGLLYALQHAQGGYVFAIDSHEMIRYYVQYQIKRILSRLAVRQIVLWRDPASSITGNITKFTFYKLLLPVHGLMVADREQTKAGKEFWMRRLSEALITRGLYVYIADQGARTFTRVVDDVQLREAIPTIWGDEPKHLNRLPVITNSKLKPLPNPRNTPAA